MKHDVTVEFKNYRPNDFPVLLRLVNDLSPHGDGITQERLKREAARPGLNPERDWWLVLHRYRAAGYLRLFPSEDRGRNECWCGVGLDPDLYEDGAFLNRAVEMIETRARDIEAGGPGPRKLFIGCNDNRQTFREVLEERGFRVICHEARLERRDLGSLAEPVVPEGVTIRTFDPDPDRQGYIDALNRAYAEDENVAPMTDERFERRLKSTNYRPDLVFVAVAGGEVIGTCDNAFVPEPGRDGLRWGIVSDLGVVSEWRGRGLGRALFRQGMAALKRAGAGALCLWVDYDNPTGAKRLYYSEGFRDSSIFVNHSKELTP